MKSKLLSIIVIAFSLGVTFKAQNYGIEKNPQRIILNITDQPATSIAVTWRTNKEYQNSKIQFTTASEWIDFKDTVITLEAKVEKILLDNSKLAFHYSGIMNNLKPNTLYQYRVGHDTIWSEWSQFRTAKKENAPFSFVYMGDPQNDIKSYCTRVFREAYKKSPDSNFWLFVGDLISTPQYDSLWNDLFYSFSFMPTTIPFALLPGNHEYPTIKRGEEKKKEFTPYWRVHFTLPENGIKGLEETSYYFDYQGTRFIMLNGNEKINEQAIWLEQLLANNTNKWTVVSMHQPLYSTGLERDGKQYRDVFLNLYDKYGVDLVLQGHDHNYARSYKLYNGNIVGKKDKGTIYVNSVSGTKYYELNSKHLGLMEKKGGKVQLYQVISVDGNNLSFKSYTVTGTLYDSFVITK
ncbi:MAG: metallophosphoesterase family protein [Melioribacteraceae bacterium]